MNPPPELITVEQFGPVWTGLCVAWTLIWLGVALARRMRSGGGGEWGTALVLALVGPSAWALWGLYVRRIAYRPETGVAGLHLVSVLLVNLLIFVLVGLAFGALLAFVRKRSAAPQSRPSGTPSPCTERGPGGEVLRGTHGHGRGPASSGDGQRH